MKKLMLLFAILFFFINESYAYEEKGDAKLLNYYADNSYDIRCVPSPNVCYISRGSGPAQPGDRIFLNFGNEDYRAVTVCNVYSDGGFRVKDEDDIEDENEDEFYEMEF